MSEKMPSNYYENHSTDLEEMVQDEYYRKLDSAADRRGSYYEARLYLASKGIIEPESQLSDVSPKINQVEDDTEFHEQVTNLRQQELDRQIEDIQNDDILNDKERANKINQLVARFKIDEIRRNEFS